MRPAVAVVLSALAMLVPLATVAVAEEPAPTQPPPTADAPAVQETTIQGTPPDLTGRWLMLGLIDLPSGHSSAPSFFDIDMRGDKPTVTQRFVGLPAAQNAALEKANAQKQAWTPTPEDLAAIRSSWDVLPPVESKMAHVHNDIAARNGFDESLKTEDRTRDAIFAIRQRQDMHASASPVLRFASVYAVLAEDDDGNYTGNLDGMTLAAAPFPIPITFKGSFRLYHLDPRPARGVLERLFGFFQGCGTTAPR